MKRRVAITIFTLVATVFLGVQSGAQPAIPEISKSFDAAKNRTTVRLAPAQLSGAKGKYHSLNVSVFYHIQGTEHRVPETLRLELLTVVKAAKLDSDLYVVFVVDGEEVFLSSDRSAVLNPVPGKRWIGERLVFRLPYGTFQKFARAKSLAVKLDGVQFDFAASHLHSLRELARYINRHAGHYLPSIAPRIVPLRAGCVPCGAGSQDRPAIAA